MNRADSWYAAAGAAVFFLLALGARDLWNPNEPVYGQALAEMARRGSWLLPTIGGQPFAEKPPLYFWLARIFSAPFGVGEFALRLPQALAGIGAVVVLQRWLAARIDRRSGWLAAGVFATTFMVWWGARSVQMDFLVCVSTLVAVRAGCAAFDAEWPPARAWFAAGLAAGLGFAAKGPVALLLPAGILAVYPPAAGIPYPRRLRPLAAGAAGLALAGGGWILLYWLAGRGELLGEMLWRQNLTRFLDAWDHRQPWWYYLKYYWIDLAPWSWLTPFAAGWAAPAPRERRLQRLGWCWILLVVLFFSLSESKRSAYILPAAPGVALVVVPLLRRLADGGLSRWRAAGVRGVLALQGGLLVAAGVTFGLHVVERFPEAAAAIRITAVTLLLAGAGAVWGATRRRPGVAALAAFAAVLLVGQLVALPAANRYKSPREFCEQVVAIAGDAPLASYRFWRWRGEYAFYTGRPIDNLDSVDELRARWRGGEPFHLLVQDARLAEAREVLGAARPRLTRRIGSKTLHLFSSAVVGAPEQE